MANGNPTPANAWAPQDELVELPSGKTARLRVKLSLKGLVRRGVMEPEVFVSLVEGTLEDPVKALDTEAHLVAEMFVEPRVIVKGKPKAGEIHIDYLADEDLAFVIERAFGGAPEATTFRDDTGGDGAGGDGEDVGQDAERDAGDGAGDARGVPARPKSRRKAPQPGT